MKELLSQIISLVFIMAPVLLLAALLVKKAGDWQKIHDKRRKTDYENMYEQIRSMLFCDNANKKLIKQCIDMLEKLPYKNREMTDVLWDRFKVKFNIGEIKAREVLTDVSEKTGIPIDMITSRWRKREIADARLILYRRCREIGVKDEDIARVSGRRRSAITIGRKTALTVPTLIEQYEKYYPEKK